MDKIDVNNKIIILMEYDNEEILKKKNEIDEIYEKYQKILVELNEKREKFIKELDDTRNDQLNIMKELAEINEKLEDYKSKIKICIKDNPNFNELDKKCQKLMSKYYDDLSPNNSK